MCEKEGKSPGGLEGVHPSHLHNSHAPGTTSRRPCVHHLWPGAEPSTVKGEKQAGQCNRRIECVWVCAIMGSNSGSG